MLTTLLWILAVFFIISNVLFLIQIIYAFKQVITEKKRRPRTESTATPRISVLIPCYNESKVIVKNAESVLASDYPNLELIIINDGSRDDTFSVLSKAYTLAPVAEHAEYTVYRSTKLNNLIVIDQQNFGKSMSLNHALQVCTGSLVATIDADTIVSEGALSHCVQYLTDHPNCHVVGGIVRVLNGSVLTDHNQRRGSLSTRLLPLYQTIEYIRSFFGGRMGLEAIGGSALVPGAFSVFKKSSLQAIGGFDPHSATEDFEVVIRLKKHMAQENIPCEIHMISHPVCWTEVPEKAGDLFYQRVRWQRGLMQTLLKHRWMIANPAAGRMGLFTLPYMLVFEGLSPLVEFLGYIVVPAAYLTGRVSGLVIAQFIVIGITFYSLLTLASVHLEERYYAKHFSKKSFITFLVYSFLENFGYRQFIFVARLKGVAGLLFNKHSWGEHERSGNVQTAPPQTENLGLALMAAIAVSLTLILVKPAPSNEPNQKVAELQRLLKSRSENIADGRMEQALADAEAIHRIAPDNAIYLSQLADLHEKMGHYDAAAAALEKLLATSTTYEDTCPSLGRIYLSAGQPEKAFNSFAWCYEKLPDNTDVIFFLAREHERRGNYETALSLYTRGSELSSTYTDMKEGITRVNSYLALNQKNKKGL